MNIVNAPQAQKWSAQFCGCGESLSTCLITCIVPCVTFGRNAEVIDEGRSSCIAQGCVFGVLLSFGCSWIYACMYREKLRAKYGLPPEPCCDCCVHYCCGSCALCQEHAELKNRGLDPSKGWVAPSNAYPPMPPTMYR